MKYELKDLIDIDKIDDLLSNFNKATGFVTAVLDLEGNILSKSGWRKICTQFHRKNPESEKNCIVSDTVLSRELNVDKQYNVYKCLNGLIDVAMPIILNGEKIGNIFTGQFFFKAPEKEYFIKQAAELGFDEKSYLEALEEVPVLSEEQVKNAMAFLLNMTKFISDMAIVRKEQISLIQELQISEKRYHDLLVNLETGIVVHAPDTSILMNNNRASELLGLTDDQMKGKVAIDPAWEFLDEDNKPLPLDSYPVNRIVTGRQPIKNQILGIHHPERNEITWVTVNGFPVFDNSREITEIVISFVDVTERKKAEEAIEKTKKYLDSIINNIADPVFVKDEQSIFLLVNDAFCEFFALSRDKIYGTTLAENLPDEEMEIFLKIDKQVLKDGIENINEENLTIRNGKTKFISTKKTRFKDQYGKKYLVGIIRDITDRKKAEDAMAQKTKELQDFYDLMIGREFKMIELKNEINELLKAQGKDKKYET